MTDKQSTKQEILSRLDELDRMQEEIATLTPTDQIAAIMAAITARKKVLRLALDKLA